MSKTCASCSKTVYPVEQLKCLDQFWHKACFRCQSCNMTLNMKTYKGYDKKPYCSAHYPQPSRFTVIADTPEMSRVAQNTRDISNIRYHQDYEKSKGAKISVTDEPLMNQQKQSMQTISQATYHGTKEKRTDMEARRQSVGEGGNPMSGPSLGSQITSETTVSYRLSRSSVSEERPASYTFYSAHNEDGSTVVHSTQMRPDSKNIGKITDYDPEDDRRRSASSPVEVRQDAQVSPRAHEASPRTSYTQDRNSGSRYSNPPAPEAVAPVPVPQPAAPAPAPTQKDRGRVYRALYDYASQDKDEVSFQEGDLIINGDPIDEGWMYGTVERTDDFGMLPSNYVEPVDE